VYGTSETSVERAQPAAPANMIYARDFWRFVQVHRPWPWRHNR